MTRRATTPVVNCLRKHRRLMGYRQIDVARLLGFGNANRISRWEKGLAHPGLENLLKLSVLYRTFPNELYYDLYVRFRHDVLKSEQAYLKKKG